MSPGSAEVDSDRQAGVFGTCRHLRLTLTSKQVARTFISHETMVLSGLRFIQILHWFIKSRLFVEFDCVALLLPSKGQFTHNDT